MVVLDRKIEETGMIGNDVKSTILGYKGEQIQIGIQAPKATPIHQQKIYRRMQQEDMSHAASPLSNLENRS